MGPSRLKVSNLRLLLFLTIYLIFIALFTIKPGPADPTPNQGTVVVEGAVPNVVVVVVGAPPRVVEVELP